MERNTFYRFTVTLSCCRNLYHRCGWPRSIITCFTFICLSMKRLQFLIAWLFRNNNLMVNATRAFNVYKMQITSSFESAFNVGYIECGLGRAGQKKEYPQNEERKAKIQRMFRLIYMQISKGCKHKQHTHYTHKHKQRKTRSLFLFMIPKWCKLKFHFRKRS